MASSLYNLALDFSKELNYTKAIMARQGDKGITVTVKPFLNGLQMDTSGGTFTLKGTTPSNRYVDNVATSVTSEEVTFSLDGTFMSEAGYYKHCYVEYRKDNQILTTQDIIFFSLGVSDISQGQADEYVSQLEELIRKYNETFDAFMAEIKGRVDSLNQQITDLTGQAKTLQDKLDALKEEISKLGNLQVMYSNSIDFGNYDYSGNPNLMANINADSFSQGSGALSVVDDGDEVVITLDPNHKLEIFKAKSQPALVVGKTYTMSVEIMLEDDFTGDPSNISLRYIKMPSWLTVLYTPYTLTNTKGVWQKLTVTAKMTTAIDNAESWFIMLQNKDANNSLSGKLRLRHAKLEEGSTATPFQPNLLAEPYNMCREYPNENIADPKVKFPIESGDHQIYQGYTEEELMIGQTYTITLKGTKPASQTFVAYNHWTARLGELKPVDGLTDVWSLTFTPTNVVAMPKLFRVYQYPQSTVGACRIDWLKIEKGDTRTPNISEYKYFGEGLKDSNNPNDYSWDITTEYTEKALTNTLNLTDPQTALGLKNFKDGAQIDGVDVATVKNLGSVLQSGSGLTTIQSDKQSAFDEFSYEFERIGDRVFFHARVKTNSKTAAASHVNLLEIPLGFQFPIGWTIIGIPLSVVQWTIPQGEISALVITDSNGKQVVKFATNRVGNHYISGEWRTADSYPETK
ncbi:BppU family phage baseplate upper protein [Enterococcus faecium]|uniref:BppU family phage baseplate upper protein n=1 Tax=Enterococcus faecium TaxID=1352 RepID=UPI000A1857E1|nr:BppU family phage baseplate upper protein [Enterococcus faecium]MDV4724956.1 BppU family phage baseplate upper protein [Enterococcus faecium]SMI70315.1 bactriophage minor structural protein [Enterococcus faecium]SMI84174.1 bactriophage minor structural protein [Enterococcus faecium]SMK09589.1 bactriophage minor structural protein [Enterococcus faecium]SMK13196.1 bactriophage minor structural protein [Enterococcus faecium]